MMCKMYKHLYFLKVICNEIILYSDIYEIDSNALTDGIKFLRNYCHEKLYGDLYRISNNIDIPDKVTDAEFGRWINLESYNNKKYSIIIDTISTERKYFNNAEELMSYFNDNIKSISNKELFDFLLSLIDRYTIRYDCFGNYLTKEPFLNSFVNQHFVSPNIDFNEDECFNGIYTFYIK